MSTDGSKPSPHGWLAPSDPRLEDWALDALSAADREDLLRAAEADPSLAAQLERLRPLAEPVRGQMVDDALAELSAPVPAPEPLPTPEVRRRLAPRWVYAMAAAAAIASLIFVVRLGREQVGAPVVVLDGPAAERVFAAGDVVSIAVPSAADEGAAHPQLFVRAGTVVRPVAVEWAVDADRLTARAPAHHFSGGHFGDVELLVVAAGTRPDAIPEDATKLPFRVAMPQYGLQGAVAMRSALRGREGLVGAAELRVPADARALRLTLRPEVKVRSGGTVCVFRDDAGTLRGLDPTCRPFEGGVLRTNIDVTWLVEDSSAAADAALVLAIAPQSASAEQARAVIRQPEPHPMWQVIRARLTRASSSASP